MSIEGEPIIDRWRDGDARCHCTHCDACGVLFRTEDLPGHMRQAHLGGKKEHEAHRQAGCNMLMLLADGVRGVGVRSEALDAWVATEKQLSDVREWIAAGGCARRP